MSIHAAVQSGMGAKTALRIWGEVALRNRGIYPVNFGWPSMSVDGRLLTYGHGAKESTDLAVDSAGDPVLTRPEEAVDRLSSDIAIASWVASILRDASVPHRIYARLYWLSGKCWADIAEQMELDTDAVQAIHLAVVMRVRRAVKSLQIKEAA